MQFRNAFHLIVDESSLEFKRTHESRINFLSINKNNTLLQKDKGSKSQALKQKHFCYI